MLGKTFKIKPEHRKAFKSLSADLEAAHIAYDLGVEHYNKASKKFWETTAKLYPETRDFQAVYNHKTMEISMKSEK